MFCKLLLFVKMDINLSLILSSFAVKGSMHEITKVFFLQSFTSSKSIIIPCLSVQNAAGSNYHHQFGTHIWFSKNFFFIIMAQKVYQLVCVEHWLKQLWCDLRNKCKSKWKYEICSIFIIKWMNLLYILTL